MFLITTAIESSWKNEEEILFLGEWCKLYNRKNVWYNLKYQTLPYHWDDRNKFQKDNILLESIYEKYLLIIANELNRIHNLDHSLKYWRIIVGLWLRYFIDILYDRYESIINANELFTINDTQILKYNLSNWVPLNYQEFHLDSVHDNWNHILYSEIIKFLDIIPYKIIDTKIFPNQKVQNSSYLKAFIKNVIIQCNRVVPKKNKEIFLVNTIWPKKDVFLLQLALNQMPNLFESLVAPVKIQRKTFDKILRTKFYLNNADNQFQAILEKFIPNFIPLAYLECYEEIKSNIERVYPKKVKKIFTGNAYSYDEGFKIWSASQVEKGAKLIIGQHGGRTGTAKIHQADNHQIKICDNYISWGWKKDKVKKITPLPSIKLSRIKITPVFDGKVLVLLPSYKKYFYHSCSMPLVGQCLKHFKDQLLVLKYLSAQISTNYNFRLGPRVALEYENRLKDRGLGGLIDNRTKSFFDSANESRLVIHTDNSTSLLETMSSNFPSLIYWNPEYYELTDEAKPYFEAFYDVGIMHYDAKSMANKINNIFSDTKSWWNQSEIQNVRKEFCNNFALTSNDWVGAWKKWFILLK